MKQHINKIAIDELSLVFGAHKGKTFRPINPEATVLGFKAGETDESQKSRSFLGDLFDKVKSAFKQKAIDTEAVVEALEDSARRQASWTVLCEVINQVNYDLSMVFGADAFSDEERKAATERVLTGFVEAMGKLMPTLLGSEDEGAKAGARHSEEDLSHLKAIAKAHDKLVKNHDANTKLLNDSKEHMDALGIHQVHEDNDGAQNAQQQKDKDQAGKAAADAEKTKAVADASEAAKKAEQAAAEKAIADRVDALATAHKAELEAANARVAEAEKAKAEAEAKATEFATKAAAEKSALAQASEIARAQKGGGGVPTLKTDGTREDPTTGATVKEARKATTELRGEKLTAMQQAIVAQLHGDGAQRPE